MASSSQIFLRALCLCLVFFTLSSANLMAVDLGQAYIKVAVARPGRGLELVVNEQAKRKTPSAIGFTTDGERLFGDAAVAYAAKSPNRVILGARSLIGKCKTSAPQGTLSSSCPRETVTVQGSGNFTGEHAVAMLLAMARRQASAALGGAEIKDVAVTVPASFDHAQRIAVMDAARIIGLNCLGVVNSNTAAAIKYALDGKARPQVSDTKSAKAKRAKAPRVVTQTVMFLDVGASSATASIARFHVDPKSGVTKRLEILAHATDDGVGGDLFDDIVMNHMADTFDAQRGKDATPARELPRVMMRLRKEARRVKEILSANTETHVSIGSLYDDQDFKMVVKREVLENAAKPLLAAIARPVWRAMAEAALKVTELDAVVPFGGASRMPRIQEIVLTALGRESLNKSINSDEAAVIGAAFFGASLSSTFRVRKLDLADVLPRTVSAEIERDISTGVFAKKDGRRSAQKVVVFDRDTAKMPSKKTLSFNRKGDFGIRLYLDLDKSGVSRFPERTLYADIKVSGVEKVLSKLQDKSKATKLTPRVALTFHLDPSGMIRVGTAESSVDETVVVEREIEVKEDNAKDNSASKKKGESGSKNDSKGDGKDGDKNKDEKAAEDKAKDNAKNEKKKKKKTRKEKSTQSIVHRHTLTVEFVEGPTSIHGLQMSGKQLEASQKLLKSLEDADNERQERADALNALEGFILNTRSQISGADEDDDLYKVSTEEERESVVSKFNEAEDWMYSEEAKQTASLRAKHHELQKLFGGMEERASELKLRPQAITELRATLKMYTERAESLEKLHIERKSKELKAFEDYRLFTAGVTKWLADNEAAQAKTPPTENPVFLSSAIQDKHTEIMKEMIKLARLEIPPEPAKPSGSAAPQNETAEGANDTAKESAAPNDSNASKPEMDPPSGGAKADPNVGPAVGAKDEL